MNRQNIEKLGFEELFDLNLLLESFKLKLEEVKKLLER